ncbi:hypothetical protein V8F20_011895 [Naviculisporaceae sp. PSN 640]
MFQPALEAIPDELCILHDGLALVLHLAKGGDRIRGEIVNTFEDLTYTFVVAVEYTNPDHRLNEALDGLRLTLMETIPTLVHILNPKNFALTALTALLDNHLAAPFRTAQAERILETARVDIKRVEQRATALTGHLHSHAARITKDHMEGIHDSVKDLPLMQQDIRDMVNDALASQDGLPKMLSDAVKGDGNEREAKINPGWMVVNGGTLKYITQSSLLSFGYYKPTPPMLQKIYSLPNGKPENSTRAQDVQPPSPTTNFQRWMMADGSDLLHIE